MLSGGSGGIKKEEPGEYSGKTVPEKISQKYHRKHHGYFTDNIRGMKKEERKAEKNCATEDIAAIHPVKEAQLNINVDEVAAKPRKRLQLVEASETS